MTYFIINSFIDIVFKNNNQILVQNQQVFEQNNDNCFLPQKYLHTDELIRKHFDLVNVVQQAVVPLYLTNEKFMMNEEDVRQTLYLVNVTKSLSRLHWSIATLHVHKLVVYQVEVDYKHGILDAPLLILQHFGIRIRSWSLLGFLYDVLKVHGSQNHLYFEIPKAKFLPMKLVHDSSIFNLDAPFYSQRIGCMLQNLKSDP